MYNGEVASLGLSIIRKCNCVNGAHSMYQSPKMMGKFQLYIICIFDAVYVYRLSNFLLTPVSCAPRETCRRHARIYTPTMSLSLSLSLEQFFSPDFSTPVNSYIRSESFVTRRVRETKIAASADVYRYIYTRGREAHTHVMIGDAGG